MSDRTPDPAEDRVVDDVIGSAVEVARAYLVALGGDDPGAVTELVDVDFRNQHHAELGSGCEGREEYARRLPGFFAAFANRRYRVLELTAGPAIDESNQPIGTTTEVVVNYRYGADIDGVRIDIPGVMWITVEQGVIVRRLDCWDSSTFHRQTAAATEPSQGGSDR